MIIDHLFKNLFGVLLKQGRVIRYEFTERSPLGNCDKVTVTQLENECFTVALMRLHASCYQLSDGLQVRINFRRRLEKRSKRPLFAD